MTGQITSNSVEIYGQTEGPPPQIGKIPGGFNILLVGSDTRVGQMGIGGDEEDETGVLNDVNILLHVSQDQTNAVAISFPRDLVVGIPECVDENGDTRDTRPNRSTHPSTTADCPARSRRCPSSPASTSSSLGLITFVGVIGMSDAVGGVEVCTDGPVIDEDTGINLPDAGYHT